MVTKTIQVETVENVTGLNSLGIITSNILRLNLTEPIDFSADIENVRFSLGSTRTTIDPGGDNIPSNFNKRVLTEQGEFRFTGIEYEDSYVAIDLDFQGSLLFVLRNNKEPLSVSEISKDRLSVTLSYDVDLEEQQVEYNSFSGNLIFVEEREVVDATKIINNLNTNYQLVDDLYAAIESLDVAWSESSKLGYVGQIEILDRLFKILDYTDTSDFPEIPQEISTPINRRLFDTRLGRINPYKIPGFRKLLLDKAEELRVEETQPQSIIKIKQAKTEKSLPRIVFSSENLPLRIGQRITANTQDFTKSFEIVIEGISGIEKRGFILFTEDSADLSIGNILNQDSGVYLVGEKTETINIVDKLSQVENSAGSLTPFLLNLVRASNKNLTDVLSSLSNQVKEQVFPIRNTSELPPGIGNSARSNAFSNAPSGFVHYRPFSSPFNPRNYCTRFTDNINCNNDLNTSLINNRSDSKNRNALAVVQSVRYPNELPLGFVSEILPPLAEDEYIQYWEEFGDKEPIGGCLSFIDKNQPEKVKLCYAVRRCTKRDFSNTSQVLQCMRGTYVGEYNFLTSNQRLDNA